MLYSLSQRRFHAFCAWPSPQPVTLSDDTVEGLEERIREAETLLISEGLPHSSGSAA
ncbi:hypothetical protein FHS44_001098 [Streptosporangium saharense]|uniref:Uncharacterized protein n=1 Tax=Streptosporangium saharense TaxID=1706840 RepID=A0A7W7VKT3_9ACTN|nr:hypothetical protein [Streptosporangium saharense]